MGDYFSSKTDEILSTIPHCPDIRAKFSTVKFKEVIENNKILLINLSKGLLGEAKRQCWE